MRTRRTALSAGLVALLLVAGACGDDGDSGDDTDTSAVDTDSGAPEGLVAEGALTVCSDTPYEPFEFEGDDGEQTGYDIDLLRAIADDGDLDLEVKDLPFDGILGSLAAGDCDVVASAVTITEERAQQVDFSDPYFDADQSLLVRAADAETYATLVGLTGQRIGVQGGTTGETYANEHLPEGATVVSFEDSDAMFAALISEDVAALLQDLPVNAYRATQDERFVLTESFTTGEQYGFPVAKGKGEILEFINDGLATLRSDGRFDEIYASYFGENE
ncbi:MAG: basic amino acid ABC transporter substrate-binding protein [Actinomycetota bacterium]|nr:basic amino acid ABC transporter substrate-binding protein [Actinomycetota bacterium]